MVLNDGFCLVSLQRQKMLDWGILILFMFYFKCILSFNSTCFITQLIMYLYSVKRLFLSCHIHIKNDIFNVRFVQRLPYFVMVFLWSYSQLLIFIHDVLNYCQWALFFICPFKRVLICLNACICSNTVYLSRSGWRRISILNLLWDYTSCCIDIILKKKCPCLHYFRQTVWMCTR